MIFVKLLFLIAGGSAVAGVTYTQVKKPDTEKTVVVSNNQESKIRAKLEKQMDVDLLKYKKGLLETTKTSYQQKVKDDHNAFEQAEQELKEAYQALNDSKTTLNSTSSQIESKYTELKTKDNEFVSALKTQMTSILDQESKKLTKEFCETQKDTYEKERNAIVTKIKAIYTTSNVENNTICSGSSANWTPLPTTSTSEETKIVAQITSELNTVCQGLNNAKTQISANATTTSTDEVSAKKSARESVIKKISDSTQTYNLQIIDIRAKENDVNMKLLNWQNKQKTYSDSKAKLQKTINEIESIEQQISNK